MAELEGRLLLDTNVVVRYLTDDPRHQGQRATGIIEGERGVILSEVIVAECAYVMASIYRMPRAAVVDALCGLIQRRNVELLGLPKVLAIEALALCRASKRVSFADALLWAEARHAGIPLATFDQSFPTFGADVELLH